MNLRKLLYWILFPACAVAVGAVLPIRTAIADITCKDDVCTMSRNELIAARTLIGQLIENNKALQEEVAYEKYRRPICKNS